jgi:predicted DNA-binding transcriptional regulator AlpA
MTIENAGISTAQKTHVAVTISPWVNEPLPDIHGLLCARDLARLTRRPRWELFRLALIGKFPRKKRYRGRPIGWCKAEVLEWMTRDLAVAPETQQRLNTPRVSKPRHARQQCLPLECRGPCVATRRSRSACRAAP